MPLREWETFYVIVGSSAAALTGLQFVVIALSADRRTGDAAALEAFGTPTIVHFCCVLTTGAMIVVPRQTPATLAACFGSIGLFGVIYTLLTAHRARRQELYQPVFEDWLFHVGLPNLAYAALLFAGVGAWRHPAGALYVVAVSVLGLLFIGIHNAWDSAVYISTTRRD